MSASGVGLTDSTYKQSPKMVGPSTEAEGTINDIVTKALLDTGSCISSISKIFYDEHLHHLEIQPLDNILKIECADGNELPYLGYVEANLTTDGIPNSKKHNCLFFITPETKYSSATPVLLGTNIPSELLLKCKENFGDTFLQKARLHTPWYLAFRCITIRDRE